MTMLAYVRGPRQSPRGARWTAAERNVRPLLDIPAGEVAQKLPASDVNTRPARMPIVLFFSPGGNCGSWCSDNSRYPYHVAAGRRRSEPPRGLLSRSDARVNVRTPPAEAYGSLFQLDPVQQQ